jgi:hypothetical protein
MHRISFDEMSVCEYLFHDTRVHGSMIPIIMAQILRFLENDKFFNLIMIINGIGKLQQKSL